MRPGRAALLLAPALLLALSACGDDPGESKSKRDAPSIPLGFELAFAGTEGEADVAPAPLVPLSPEELAARIKAGNVRLIDVRTDEEVAQGMIPGAEHIALDRFDPAKLDLSDGREVVL
ncbi:MAG: rhodanese-like domain-containing protein [Erythrobacter sp.]|uniref:rhodanese-like domain-containing protein n=1 Tax=Erythrobacter sp. TaxID=1042 RepID=UPI0025FF203B|nr:rhodanese-like domain-containing protein [Erythrobacter sp.]MCL9999913.1 rhodanese-like domain-containing protein [Erythrobacter sp.]